MPIEVTISVKDETKFEDFERVLDEDMTGIMTVLGERLTGDAIGRSPVYRGLFRQSISPEIEKPEPGKIVCHVFSSSPYGPIIEGVDDQGNETEFGRRPGAAFPNIGELKLWVERVINPPEAELDDVIFRVGSTIVSRGIKPVRPIGKALRANEAFIVKEIQTTLDGVLSKL